MEEPMLVLINGKVTSVARRSGSFFTILTAPSADEYGYPPRVEVRSAAKIGDVGQVVSVRARLGGMVKKSRKVDQSTGEIREASFVNHWLDLVEG